ncbi:MAG TPA: DNA circularization N-terminal domain-containing protein [Rhizomicrobium sp.]
MSFTDELQQASFRGVPFGVRSANGRFGRRIALHEYPMRDKPWAEDLGRAARQISLEGFLISDSGIYGGGDVLDQREQMIAACEQEGSGTLVHPTLGELTVSLRGGLVVTERWDNGRYFEIQFEFVESGDRVFPSDSTDNSDATDSAADDLDAAAGDDFTGDVSDVIGDGPAITDMLTSTVNGWLDVAGPLAADATSLLSMVGTLSGEYGRYFGGRTRGFGSAAQPVNDETVASLIVQGASSRAAIAQASASLQTAAAGGQPAAIATAGQAFAAAMLAAMVDPADGVRLLGQLGNFYPAQYTSSAPMGQALAQVQTATGALLRRAAIGALARAVAQYQPASQDDASAVMTSVSGQIADEITAAGDSGDDASFVALRSLRAAVVTELSAKGALLPAMRQFSFGAALPSLVLANRLYRDPMRADELTTEANPIHPAFFPNSFRALAS